MDRVAVPAPDPARLRDVFDRLEAHIERRWGVPVRIGDVPDPFTGDLDGETIVIDHEVDIAAAVFIVIHLFGHTVQWNVSPRARELGQARPAQWSEAQLSELAAYEHEACRYSLQLLHDAGVTDLDQWVSDFAACDTAYLIDLYRTGIRRPFRSFWRHGSPLLEPLAIPEFSPTRWHGRFDGTVV